MIGAGFFDPISSGRPEGAPARRGGRASRTSRARRRGPEGLLADATDFAAAFVAGLIDDVVIRHMARANSTRPTFATGLSPTAPTARRSRSCR